MTNDTFAAAVAAVPAEPSDRISRDIAYQALSALGHAMTICDGVPTRADSVGEGALKYLGQMVNYQESTGHHGYRMIQDALAALGAELSRTEAATPPIPAPVEKSDEPQYQEDPVDILRSLCCAVDRQLERGEHYPSPTSQNSPIMIAARRACVERGFTAGGLAIATQPGEKA